MSGPESINVSLSVGPEPLHALPRTQYGHFIEHLGRCINKGIWAEGESEDMFLGGVRWELIDAMKSINPALIRYPGGCFADGYHWQDGIGPKDNRPVRKNRAWKKLGKRLGPDDDNHFGTDEFLRLCEEVGAEPQLTANVGSGTAEEAAAWVEYTNGPVDSKWGAERAGNGHPEPYSVKYWFVGNEIFWPHEIGHLKPAAYVGKFNEFGAAMRRVDPDIKLIACGNILPPGFGEKINPIVLAGAGEQMDYLSIHMYAPTLVSIKNFVRYQVLGRKGSASKDIYYDVIGSIDAMEKYVERSVLDARTHSPNNKKIPLSFDEWNLWFAFYSDIVQSNFNLRDGLWVASMFNMFHRFAPDMPLANIAQMVNCAGIIYSRSGGTFLTASALVYKIYTEHAGGELLPSNVDGPALPHKTELPVLDVSATRTDETVSLFMVNRHYDAGAVVACDLKGMEVAPDAARIELHHSNPVQYNTVKDPHAVQINESRETLSVNRQGTTSGFELKIPAHSLTCLELAVKDI